MPSITSPQEKEKLRKRLQKLFQQKQHYLEESGAGEKIMGKMKNKQYKNKQSKKKESHSGEGPREQQQGDKLKGIKTKSIDKNRQPGKNKSSTMSLETSKQNGFVKSSKKKSEKINENHHVTQSPKLQENNVTPKGKPPAFPAKTKTEKGNTKTTPLKQQNKTKITKSEGGEQKPTKVEEKSNTKISPTKEQTKTTATRSKDIKNNMKKDLKLNKQQKEGEKVTIPQNKKSAKKNSPPKPQEKETPNKDPKISKQNNKLEKKNQKNSLEESQTQEKEMPKKHPKVAKQNNKVGKKNMKKSLEETEAQQKHMPNKVPKNIKQNNKVEKKTIKKSLVQTESKSPEKSQNSQKKKNQPEIPITKKNSSTTNNIPTKMNNNQKKKAKKRAASENLIKQEEFNKKPKLVNESSNVPKESKTKISNKKKDKKTKNNLTNHQLANGFDDSQDEFDINDMPGCVRGGDFDSHSEEEEDDMEWNYWNQEEDEENSISDDGESMTEINSEDLTPEEEFNGNEAQTQLEQYENNESMGSEEEYFDSEDDDDDDDDDDSGDYGEDEFYDYYNDSEEEEEEEEEEDYSDFDENDYEEDEDSYNYSMDSEDDYSSNYNNSSYDFHDDEGDDDDYELPKHVPEDLIIHKGTATKHDLKPEHNVTFDSENEETQIVELEEQNTVKIINQPKAYEKEELLKLKYEEKSLKALTFHKKEETTTLCDTEDCPKLVPIVDEDGFQLYNPNEETDNDEVEEEEGDQEELEEGDDEEEDYEDESMEEYENDDMDDVSLGSEYTEINSDDADSLLSEDINEKYLNRGHEDSESDYSIDEDIWNRKHKVDVIDATGYECEGKVGETKDQTDVRLNDDIKQIPSLKLYENVDLKTKSSILSTTIINKKIFKSLEEDNKEKVKTNKIAEETNNKMENKKETEPTKPLPEQPEVVKEPEEIPEENIVEKTQEEQQPTTKVAKTMTQSLAGFETKFFNALDSNLVVVLLKDPFYIYGTVRLTLLAGNVQVYGHELKLNTEVEIFSPRGCSEIEISPSSVKNKMTKEQLKEILKSYEQNFALNDLKTIQDSYNFETDAVVLLKRNEARRKLVQQFKKFMNENVFPNINNINNERPLYNTEYLLRCMINTSAQEQKCLRLPRQWQQIGMTNKSRIMLAGGKSVGKSTLLRYLINRLLPQKVLLIDLDIGQPEVFVPQTVSCTIVEQPLLGPGFMLNLQPEISFAVGHTNIALCAHKYMQAVRALINHCKTQEAYNNIPWLINTMGYNKGFGLELISAIAQELPLTDLIQLQSSKEINNFDSILHAHVLSKVPRIMFSSEEDDGQPPNYRLHVWQSAVQQESRYQKEWEMSAKDLRYAMLLARLSSALQGHAEWLTDIKPLSASLNDLKIVNLMENTAAVSTEELAKSVEANLVYLCHHQDDVEPLKCLGIGVVRAIDFHVQQLYLIPALPYTQLKEINCLALGEMPLPTSLFTNQGSRVKNTAPFVYNTVAANASKAIKQIYHRPRKFLTGKHKTLD